MEEIRLKSGDRHRKGGYKTTSVIWNLRGRRLNSFIPAAELPVVLGMVGKANSLR